MSQNVLVAIPKALKDYLYIVPGSVEVKCSDCGQPVMVSPSSQQLMKDGGVIVVCIDCGLKRMKAEPAEIVQVPGSDKEVEDWRRRN